MAAEDRRRRCRSALSLVAQGLRRSQLRHPSRCRSDRRRPRHRPADRARQDRLRRLHPLDAGRAPARTEPTSSRHAQPHHQADPVGPRPAARVALFQARGPGDLPHAGADGRQSGGRARRLLRLFRQGTEAAQRRRGRPFGRPPAVAGAPPARPCRGSGAGRTRSRAGARPRTLRHRPGDLREGNDPARARPPSRDANAGAASRGLARRPVAGHDRTHHDSLRAAGGAGPARSRGARPVHRPGADRDGRRRQPQRRRRGLAGRQRVLRPRRPG